ncbi:hypothetical protein SLA2020_149020 [Shorea laevis]
MLTRQPPVNYSDSSPSPNKPGSPPSWQALVLVAHHLNPKTLAIASCVSKTWFHAMSLDLLWQPLCTAHFPPISVLKITNPSISFRRLYSIGSLPPNAATNLPLNPVFHLKTSFLLSLCAPKPVLPR